MNTTTQPNPAPAWTPGPWTAHDIQRNGIPYSPVTATTMIAKVYPTTYGDDAQSQANARLIAAAPEMAEALAAMLEHEGETVADGIGIEHDGPNLQAAKANARAILARLHGEGGGV